MIVSCSSTAGRGVRSPCRSPDPRPRLRTEKVAVAVGLGRAGDTAAGDHTRENKGADGMKENARVPQDQVRAS